MKKKILYLIIAVVATFSWVAGVNAVNVQDSADYKPMTWTEYFAFTGTGSLGGRSLTESEMCEWGGYSGFKIGGVTMNAVRMTIVDLTTGARVSNSVDFYSGGLPSSFNRYTNVATGNKTRNEIISGGTGYTISGTRPYINYWANLPEFVNGGGGITLRNYFVSKFSSDDVTDMMTIFNMMNYNGYKDALIYENHALLVEPIFQFWMATPVEDDGCTPYTMVSRSAYQEFVNWYSGAYLKRRECQPECTNHCDCAPWRQLLDQAKAGSGIWGAKLATEEYKVCNCQLSYTYYYGTATEILYMMQQKNDKILTYKFYSGGSGKTIINNIASLVHDNKNVAGLLDATGVANASEAYKHMVDSYGLGTMHVWMKDVMEGCPNGQCPMTCPDGTILAEGEDPATACPPTYCPDGVTPIPYGQTAETVCPGYTPTCKYDLKTKITNDCNDGQEGYIKDIGENEDGTINLEEWKCIFDTANAPRNTYEGEFYHPSGSTYFDGNRYCRVACRETVKYKLPSTFEEVAGRRFTIGASNDYTSGLTPNVIEGTSTCSTAYYPGTEIAAINIEQFKIDYNDANRQVVLAWNNLQNAIAKEKAFQAASITSTSSGNHEQCLEKKKVQRQVGTQLVGPYGPADQASCDACSALIGYSCCENQPIYQEFEETKTWEECFDDGVADFEHGHSTYDVYTWTGSYNNGVYSGTASYTTTSDGHHGPTKDAVWAGIQAEISNARNVYNYWINYRNNLIAMLNQCNNFQRTYSEFEPTLSFAYSETKYKGSYKLVIGQTDVKSATRFILNNQQVDAKSWTTVGYTGSTDTFTADISSSYGNIAYIDRTDCGNELQPCINNPGIQAYPNNTSVIQTTRKTYNYELPSNANRYVAKNGKSYNTANEAEMSNYPYLDTGKSNMPVNYETQGGWYHYYYDYYYADGTANLFGTNQKFLKYNKVDPGGTSSYNGLTLADNLLYHCIYRVNCGLVDCKDTGNTCPDGSEMPANGKCPDYTVNHKICPSGIPMPISGVCPDGKGLNIIYRTISLNDPFPGEHGEGREAGANWDGQTTVLGTRMSFIDAYITNNRGVTTEDVYQETPMYQFTLTPANIRTIRKYNRSTGNDYNDYNFECSNGKYCKSEFLEEGIGNGYFGFSSKNPNGGSCFNAYSTDWESCRYSSIGG